MKEPEGALYEMFKFCFGGDLFDDILDVLTINPSEGEYASLWTNVEGIYDTVMVPLAVGLVFIYFLVFLLHRFTDERMTWEQVFMLFVKLVVAKFIIDNGFDILSQLWGFGISIIAELSEYKGYAFSLEELKAPWESLTGVKWPESPGLIKDWGIVAWIQMLIPMAITWILKIAINVICYSRLLELLVRTAMAPLAFADFFTEGLHGAGWKFLKSYFAVCLQGFVIAVIAILFSILGQTLEMGNGFFMFALKYAIIGFAALACVAKSQSIVKEIVNVH